MNLIDGQLSKPIRNQVIDPKRPSSLFYDETRREVEYFSGHRSQARNSPSENFWSPFDTGKQAVHPRADTP